MYPVAACFTGPSGLAKNAHCPTTLYWIWENMLVVWALRSGRTCSLMLNSVSIPSHHVFCRLCFTAYKNISKLIIQQWIHCFFLCLSMQTQWYWIQIQPLRGCAWAPTWLALSRALSDWPCPTTRSALTPVSSSWVPRVTPPASIGGTSRLAPSLRGLWECAKSR